MLIRGAWPIRFIFSCNAADQVRTSLNGKLKLELLNLQLELRTGCGPDSLVYTVKPAHAREYSCLDFQLLLTLERVC